MDWDDRYLFVQAVNHSGFASAARALNIQKSKISRRVGALEARVGVCLIERSTRHFAVTPVGGRYYDRCMDMLAAAEAADRVVADGACTSDEAAFPSGESRRDFAARSDPNPDNTDRAPRRHQLVHDHILERIKSGELVTGSKLPAERELSATLGVARQAIREAIRSLEMSGVLRLERGANGGAFVRETGPDGLVYSVRNMLILGRLPLIDLLEVRASLLGQAVRLAASRGTAKDFMLIGRNIDHLARCVASGDQISTIVPSTDFFRLTARASCNPLMTLFVDAIAILVEDMLTALKQWPKIDGVTPRRQVLAAMRARRGKEAEETIRAHLEESNELLLDYEHLLPR